MRDVLPSYKITNVNPNHLHQYVTRRLSADDHGAMVVGVWTNELDRGVALQSYEA